MVEETEYNRRKFQRNVATAAAVGFIVLSMALSVPRALKHRSELKRNNDRLIELQDGIVVANQKTVQIQTEIRKVQSQIESLIHPTAH